ncbi:unnamed protein product [Mytilus coruscus]|uniref:Peptidase aspartic putative domain-containing protein n=1 Tax=Mytilus coruscus TaxID=42192 RepID=A0A6J8DY63_MYTCO|nr:unnamed protein product [Mytilus coruscus]
MQKCEISLSQLGFISDIDNSDNLRKIVKRLPMHLRVKWVDVAHSITESGREPRFTDLTKFIDQKSRIAASMYGLDLAKERVDNKGSSGMRSKPHDYVREMVSTYATNNLHTIENVKHEQKCICRNCTCRYIEFCSKFKSMSLADRLKFVSRMKLCYNCLKGKHNANICRKPKACTVSDCNFKHNLLLHNWVKPESDHTATHPSVNCAATDSSFVRNCLGIILVIVRGGDGNSCQTYALLDDGADKTLCDERLLKNLYLTSRPVTFHMSTVSSSSNTIHGQEADLQIRSIDGNKDDSEISLQKVWSVKKLPIYTRSSAENFDISKLKYLADINIPKIDTKDVMLLIGTDSPEAHIPLPVQRQIERMWTADFNDNKNDDKNLMSEEDKQALNIIESSITHDDCHYKQGLPWRDKITVRGGRGPGHQRKGVHWKEENVQIGRCLAFGQSYRG